MKYFIFGVVLVKYLIFVGVLVYDNWTWQDLDKMAAAFSAIYFLNLKGDILIQRVYKEEVE